MKMIKKKNFVAITLASDKEIFVMHVAYLRAKMLIHLAQKA